MDSLIEFLAFRGWKVLFDVRGYLALEHAENLDKHSADRAIDDAFERDLVDVRIIGDIQVVEWLGGGE